MGLPTALIYASWKTPFQALRRLTESNSAEAAAFAHTVERPVWLAERAWAVVRG